MVLLVVAVVTVDAFAVFHIAVSIFGGLVCVRLLLCCCYCCCCCAVSEAVMKSLQPEQDCYSARWCFGIAEDLFEVSYDEYL